MSRLDNDKLTCSSCYSIITSLNFNKKDPTCKKCLSIKCGFELNWEKFSDIPINKNEEIEEEFLHFSIWTDRYTILHWFEDKYNITLWNIM